MSEPIPAWKVEAILPETGFLPGQGPIEGFRVTFVTATGIQGSVFVPRAVIGDKAAIARSINETVASLNDIHNLTG